MSNQIICNNTKFYGYMLRKSLDL